MPDEKHDTCPVCENRPEKKSYTVQMGKNSANRITKVCPKCLGSGKVPKK